MIKVLGYVTLGMLILSSCGKEMEIRQKYENGDIAEECEMNDGLRSGDCIHYYRNGEIQSISRYKKDTLDGISRFYHENGKLNWEVNFTKGVKSGVINYYDSTGSLFQTSSFKNSLLDGKTYTYVNGKVESEMTYIQGNVDGFHFHYYLNGQIQYITKFNEGVTVWSEKYDSTGILIDRQSHFKLSTQRIGDTLRYLLSMMEHKHDVVAFIPDSSIAHILFSDYERLFSTTNELQINVNLRKYNGEYLVGQVLELDTLDGEKAIVANTEFINQEIQIPIESGE
jgi:antitoxin component YwqK of YwqJK toxin-antitoxin module